LNINILFRAEIDFEQACNETLESLCEYFEQIVEDNPDLENPDILFSVCIMLITCLIIIIYLMTYMFLILLFIMCYRMVF